MLGLRAQTRRKSWHSCSPLTARQAPGSILAPWGPKSPPWPHRGLLDWPTLGSPTASPTDQHPHRGLAVVSPLYHPGPGLMQPYQDGHRGSAPGRSHGAPRIGPRGAARLPPPCLSPSSGPVGPGWNCGGSLAPLLLALRLAMGVWGRGQSRPPGSCRECPGCLFRHQGAGMLGGAASTGPPCGGCWLVGTTGYPAPVWLVKGGPWKGPGQRPLAP